MMQISSWYATHFESRLQGRYITLKDIHPLLNLYQNKFLISTIGTSENGIEIPLLTLGSGSKKILMWSQMHGNESTTTKAIFDFLKFLSLHPTLKEDFEKLHTLYIVPILNPDGATAYTRENFNGIDLNRDAVAISQKESNVLATLYKDISPDLCLNMHDQRSIFGLEGGFPATLSFLAPAANEDRSITPARTIAMEHIVRMYAYLQPWLKNQIGRYDDGFNINCVGDMFTHLKTPTILFEAGHFPDDYNRDISRKFVFLGLISLFKLDTLYSSKVVSSETYFNIPENKKNYRDIHLLNVALQKDNHLYSIYLQYKEVLVKEAVVFELYIDSIEKSSRYYGHQTFDLHGGKVLVNSQENIEIGQKITTIFDKNQNLMLI